MISKNGKEILLKGLKYALLAHLSLQAHKAQGEVIV